MTAERNSFHRWRGMTTIGYELEASWEISVKSERSRGARCPGFFLFPHNLWLMCGHLVLNRVASDSRRRQALRNIP